MRTRGRSQLFGRPGELLVDEPPPRIEMPLPPAMPFRLDDVSEETASNLAEPDEESSEPAGPLRIFVGPPAAAEPARPPGPVLRLSSLSSGEGPPGGAPVAARPTRSAPAVDLRRPDALGGSRDLLNRRVPLSRAAAASIADPLVTEVPGASQTTRRRPADDGHFVTELPVFSPSLPDITDAGRDDPTDAGRAPAGISLGGGGRSAGIPTLASRGRARAPELTPVASFDDEEATRIDLTPADLFETAISAPGDAPAWDDPRFRKASAGELAFATPAPSLPPGLELVEATDPPPDDPVTQVPAPDRALPPGRGAGPVAPPPIVTPPRMVPVGSRSRLAYLLALLLLALVLAGMARERLHPGGFAALLARARVSSGGAAAPASGASVEPAVPVGPAFVSAPPEAGVPVAVEPAPEAPVAPPEAPPVVVPAPPVPVVETAAAPGTPIEDRRGGFEAPIGKLLVLCDLTAKIYVDGVFVGATNSDTPIDLAAGTHDMKVVAGSRSRTQRVRVDAGQLRMVQIKLNR